MPSRTTKCVVCARRVAIGLQCALCDGWYHCSATRPCHPRSSCVPFACSTCCARVAEVASTLIAEQERWRIGSPRNTPPPAALHSTPWPPCPDDESCSVTHDPFGPAPPPSQPSGGGGEGSGAEGWVLIEGDGTDLRPILGRRERAKEAKGAVWGGDAAAKWGARRADSGTAVGSPAAAAATFTATAGVGVEGELSAHALHDALAGLYARANACSLMDSDVVGLRDGTLLNRAAPAAVAPFLRFAKRRTSGLNESLFRHHRGSDFSDGDGGRGSSNRSGNTMPLRPRQDSDSSCSFLSASQSSSLSSLPLESPPRSASPLSSPLRPPAAPWPTDGTVTAATATTAVVGSGIGGKSKLKLVVSTVEPVRDGRRTRGDGGAGASPQGNLWRNVRQRSAELKAMRRKQHIEELRQQVNSLAPGAAFALDPAVVSALEREESRHARQRARRSAAAGRNTAAAYEERGSPGSDSPSSLSNLSSSSQDSSSCSSSSGNSDEAHVLRAKVSGDLTRERKLELRRLRQIQRAARAHAAANSAQYIASQAEVQDVLDRARHHASLDAAAIAASNRQGLRGTSAAGVEEAHVDPFSHSNLARHGKELLDAHRRMLFHTAAPLATTFAIQQQEQRGARNCRAASAGTLAGDPAASPHRAIYVGQDFAEGAADLGAREARQRVAARRGANREHMGLRGNDNGAELRVSAVEEVHNKRQ